MPILARCYARDVDLFAESALDTTVAIAQSLTTRVGLPPDLAAAIALVDAIEGGRWRAGTLEDAFGELAGADRSALVAAIETLIHAGVVLETGGRHALAPEVRELLAVRDEGTTTRPATELAELAQLLGPHAAVVVAVVADPVSAIAEIEEGLGRSVAILSDRADVRELRDAWLRDEVVAVAPIERLWISAASRVPARVVACLDEGSAGETIALLRRHRRVAVWQPAVARGPRSAPPVGMESLVYTMWNGLRTPTPAIRVAALNGTPTNIERTAAAVAAAHGLPLTRVTGSDFDSVRAALTKNDTVVLLDGVAGLPPLHAAAIAALLAQTGSIVMIAGTDLPTQIATISHTIHLTTNG